MPQNNAQSELFESGIVCPASETLAVRNPRGFLVFTRGTRFEPAATEVTTIITLGVLYCHARPDLLLPHAA